MKICVCVCTLDESTSGKAGRVLSPADVTVPNCFHIGGLGAGARQPLSVDTSGTHQPMREGGYALRHTHTHGYTHATHNLCIHKMCVWDLAEPSLARNADNMPMQNTTAHSFIHSFIHIQFVSTCKHTHRCSHIMPTHCVGKQQTITHSINKKPAYMRSQMQTGDETINQRLNWLNDWHNQQVFLQSIGRLNVFFCQWFICFVLLVKRLKTFGGFRTSCRKSFLVFWPFIDRTIVWVISINQINRWWK